jgi:hypothetical protein
MRKKWLIVTGACVLLLGSAGCFGYQFMFHREIRAADVHVDERFFDFSDVINESQPTAAPGVSQSNQTSPQGASTNQPVSASGSSAATQTPATTNGVGTTTPNATPSQPPTVGSIREKYYPRFEKLQSVAQSRLNQLISNAKQDYKKSKKTGSPSLADLAATYTSAANKLQTSVDQAFYLILGQMKDELSQAGLPLDLADEAESVYQARKTQKKAELLGKAAKF